MSAIKLGILGGGQLGRMLLTPAYRLGLDCSVLDPNPDAACRSCCGNFVVGSYQDYETVYSFGKQCSVVTVEIEDVNVDALRQLELDGVAVYPSPQMLGLIQDKGLQKQFFADHGFASTEFFLVESCTTTIDPGFFPAVAKLRRSGYDGKGVWTVDDFSMLGEIPYPIILEKRVDIQAEYSVIVARSKTGEMTVYPPTRLVVDTGTKMLDYLITDTKLTPIQHAQIQTLALNVAKALNLVGVLAVELFLTKSGEILINELSPRPHNTGHHTIEGSYCSQYEQHLRAILGWPLGRTDGVFPVVGMLNLVGPATDGHLFWDRVMAFLADSDLVIHHYGKSGVRPGRKLGHITLHAQSALAIENKIKELKKRISL